MSATAGTTSFDPVSAGFGVIKFGLGIREKFQGRKRRKQLGRAEAQRRKESTQDFARIVEQQRPGLLRAGSGQASPALASARRRQKSLLQEDFGDIAQERTRTATKQIVQAGGQITSPASTARLERIDTDIIKARARLASDLALGQAREDIAGQSVAQRELRQLDIQQALIADEARSPIDIPETEQESLGISLAASGLGQAFEQFKAGGGFEGIFGQGTDADATGGQDQDFKTTAINRLIKVRQDEAQGIPVDVSSQELARSLTQLGFTEQEIERSLANVSTAFVNPRIRDSGTRTPGKFTSRGESIQSFLKSLGV